MKNPFYAIDWKEKVKELDTFSQDSIELHAMNQGNEAEVVKISTSRASYVLKKWNQESKPDIQFQYQLLRVLDIQGVSVSKAIGWGYDEYGHSVLLTTFDGTPPAKLSKELLVKTARLLSDIHRISADELALPLPTYPFVNYFYQGIEKHPDLNQAVWKMVNRTKIKQDCVIHGDFHFENVMEHNGRLTVIDWTNGQLGDARYDFAWSYFLLKVYGSLRIAPIFRSTYLQEISILEDDLQLFDALACMRWVLLNRNQNVPIRANTISKVEKLIKNNPYLMELEIKI